MTDRRPFQVGDRIKYGSFGFLHDAVVIKVTPTRIQLRWVAKSSGKVHQPWASRDAPWLPKDRY